MVVMGRIVAPYGVFGWLKVVPDTEAFDGLFDYDTWWLGKGNDWRELLVETAKVHNDVLVVKLKGIDDRDAADDSLRVDLGGRRIIKKKNFCAGWHAT